MRTSILSLPPRCWRRRSAQPNAAFYVGAGSPSSGPHACTASAFSSQSSPQVLTSAASSPWDYHDISPAMCALRAPHLEHPFSLLPPSSLPQLNCAALPGCMVFCGAWVSCHELYSLWGAKPPSACSVLELGHLDLHVIYSFCEPVVCN